MEVEGRPLPKPVDYGNAEGLVPDAHDVLPHYLINHFGAALAKGDTARALHFQKLFESNGLTLEKGATTYALIEVIYDPLERWKSGKTKRRELARYTLLPEKTPIDSILPEAHP